MMRHVHTGNRTTHPPSRDAFVGTQKHHRSRRPLARSGSRRLPEVVVTLLRESRRCQESADGAFDRSFSSRRHDETPCWFSHDSQELRELGKTSVSLHREAAIASSRRATRAETSGAAQALPRLSAEVVSHKVHEQGVME
jgi:hypothetical protein